MHVAESMYSEDTHEIFARCGNVGLKAGLKTEMRVDSRGWNEGRGGGRKMEWRERREKNKYVVEKGWEEMMVGDGRNK